MAVQARVQNNGQSCIAAKRFIVEDAVYDEFTTRFAEAMAGLAVGDPFDPATDVGPLVSAAQRQEIAAQVDDAKAKGAVVACGGEVPDGPGWYYPPTVLSEVTPAMRVFDEEVFGPVAVVERAADLDEAIDAGQPDQLRAGLERLDDRRRPSSAAASTRSRPARSSSTPWWRRRPRCRSAGIKRSGYGRELSALGIKEFCNAKSVGA